MKECKECGGTGLAINDKFCKCIDGTLRKAAARAERAKTSAPKKVEKPPRPVSLNLIDLQIGDWIEHNGIIGSVVEIDEYGNQFRLITSPREKTKAQAWITYRGQTPLPLERFEDPETLKQLVDMALLFKDENWFNELVGGKR